MNRLPTIASLLFLACPLLSSDQAYSQERLLIDVDDLFALRNVGSPRVSPDGEWIAYTVSTTSLEKERSFTRVWMVSADGNDRLPMTAEGTSSSSPAWSPDGRYLTFTAARDEGETQVWALDRRGGEAVALTDVEQGINSYRWSPDGTPSEGPRSPEGT